MSDRKLYLWDHYLNYNSNWLHKITNPELANLQYHTFLVGICLSVCNAKWVQRGLFLSASKINSNVSNIEVYLKYMIKFQNVVYANVNIKNNCLGLPWWGSGWGSACRCRGHGFKPRSGRIPRAAERLGPWATIAGPACLEPVLRNGRGRNGGRPAHRNEEWSPLAATGEGPRAEARTQHSHTYIHKYIHTYINNNYLYTPFFNILQGVGNSEPIKILVYNWINM